MRTVIDIAELEQKSRQHHREDFQRLLLYTPKHTGHPPTHVARYEGRREDHFDVDSCANGFVGGLLLKRILDLPSATVIRNLQAPAASTCAPALNPELVEATPAADKR